MALPGDEDLLWIAEMALTAPLPAGCAGERREGERREDGKEREGKMGRREKGDALTAPLPAGCAAAARHLE